MSWEKEYFDEHGYIAVPAFLNAREVEELQSETSRFIKEVVPSIPLEEVYYEHKGDTSTLKQVQKLYLYDPYFERLSRSANVVGLAERLLGGAVSLQNMQYFNKLPGIGQATPAHQDGYYFMIKPQQAVTMWLSLGEADASNGAVCYTPGSHKQGVRPHGSTGTLGFSQGISDWTAEDAQAERQMAARAGDLLVHHSLTIHRANNNSSERDRKAIGFIFYRQDVEIDEQAHAAYQRQLNRELKQQEKI